MVPDPSSEARIEALVEIMTAEEKVAQLVCVGRTAEATWLTDSQGRLEVVELERRFPHGFGQLGRPSRQLPPAEAARLTNEIQQMLATRTRLGIGALFNEEGVHGHTAVGATSYPVAIALGSTWDPDLVERVYEAVAREVRARGSNYVYAPVLDLARDPRWGRIEETFGEDPYLVARMGVAAVRGLQGDEWSIPPDRVLACVKHFAGHGAPEAGVNAAPLHAGERELREEHLVPFEDVVRDARPGAVMAAYHEIDGVPCHANRWLLTGLLRLEWGFTGMVSSDGFGIPQLVTDHHVAENHSEAAKVAIEAGVDVEVPEAVCFPSLVGSAQPGGGSVEQVDRAVRNVLRAKERLGLIDGTVAVDPDTALEIVNQQAHRDLALEAARRSIILLANEGNALPLEADGSSSIAVIGPHAAELHLGGYAEDPGTGASILEGIRRAADWARVSYAEGCRVTEGPSGPAAWWADEVTPADPDAQDDLIAEAVAVASTADVAILIIGGSEATAREGWAVDHLGDRDSIELPGRQMDLVAAVCAIGIPVIAVVMGGRPLDLTSVADRCSSVLQVWYPGQEGGTAVAEALFGEVNPSGKLPVTLARSTGQIPIHARRKPSAGRGYLFTSNQPLFPLGHGLSYTTFDYESLVLDPEMIPVGAETEARVIVRNTGNRRGVEVVQCYVRDRVGSITRPRLSLRGFTRVDLMPGEAKPVSFALRSRDLALVDHSMQWTVEPGEFDVLVGGSSLTDLEAVLTVR